MAGKLYVVGTPIGNLEDISARAVRILSEVDFIAAEDTRVTLKLLNHFNIKKPMISYFEHNKLSKGTVIIDRIKNGETAAIVTDAGMPAISDPGEDLVREAINCGVCIESVPGPSALTAALSISGMKSERFCFEGFLSAEKKERKSRLTNLKDEERTMVFYEAPHKLKKTLADMLEIFGNREVSVVKEITKTHETTLKTTLDEAVKYYAENEPKGEYVIIVHGAKKEVEKYTLKEAVSLCLELIKKGESKTEAAKQIARLTGIKKSDIYKEVVK